MNFITNHVVKPLGKDILESIDGHRLQMFVNSQADQELSYSVVQHLVSFLKDIFDLAVNDQFLQRSPANRLTIPRVMRSRILSPEGGLDTGKFFLSLEQLRRLFTCLPNVGKPDRLIVMLASLCALRVGEIAGLTWRCYTDAGLYVMQRVYRGVMDTPKSEASRATVPAPTIIRAALDRWKTECHDASDGAFVFASKRRTPMNAANFLRRVLQPAGVVATSTIANVGFQTLRRTWATWAPTFGADLKIIEAVLRHSASLNFSVGTYQQAIRERVLEVMNKLAEAVAAGLEDSDHFKAPIEPELHPLAVHGML